MGFSDVYVEKRVRKNVFFKHINMLIDWSVPEKEIDKMNVLYKYSAVLLFAHGFTVYCALIILKIVTKLKTSFLLNDF
ncbi:MAG: hypothetical protein LBF04_00745 [Prevotellaceae bacterium]|nr:hypothetical protein [Prevotellaceae bacterium]